MFDQFDSAYTPSGGIGSVCGTEIDPADAVASEEQDGHTFYFCSAACHDAFVKDPHRYGHPA